MGRRRPEAPRDEERQPESAGAIDATAETDVPDDAEAPRDEDESVHAMSGIKFANPHTNLHTRLHNA